MYATEPKQSRLEPEAVAAMFVTHNHALRLRLHRSVLNQRNPLRLCSCLITRMLEIASLRRGQSLPRALPAPCLLRGGDHADEKSIHDKLNGCSRKGLDGLWYDSTIQSLPALLDNDPLGTADGTTPVLGAIQRRL